MIDDCGLSLLLVAVEQCLGIVRCVCRRRNVCTLAYPHQGSAKLGPQWLPRLGRSTNIYLQLVSGFHVCMFAIDKLSD